MKFYRLFGLSLLVAGASSGVSAYMNANCGSADDWPSHHLCCSQPGASENSIWAAAPGIRLALHVSATLQLRREYPHLGQ